MIAVLGADSLVGRYVLSGLAERGAKQTGITRKSLPQSRFGEEWVSPQNLDTSFENGCSTVICVAHIWVLPDYLDAFRKLGVTKIVAISSTSRFTKAGSNDVSETALSEKLEVSENMVQNYCNDHSIDWTILQPTLIYGDNSDKNISEIAKFIKRFGFFPLFGRADGLRQPIHARDVAKATIQAAFSKKSSNQTYIITGGETLSYRDMVSRIFHALGKPVRTPTMSITIFTIAISLFRLIPRFKNWTPDMALRMNRDLKFDSEAAGRDWNFAPADFVLDQVDVGNSSGSDS